MLNRRYEGSLKQLRYENYVFLRQNKTYVSEMLNGNAKTSIKAMKSEVQGYVVDEHHKSLEMVQNNMYINQQDAQNSCDQTRK